LWSHFQCIFTVLLLIISPWTGMFPFIGTIWIPFLQGWFVLSLIKISLAVLK
jgi:hypothetical protein